MKNYLKYFMVGAFAFSIASCTAVYTRMSKSDMQVKVEMSDTIWLDPVAPEQQTIYVQIRHPLRKIGLLLQKAGAPSFAGCL